MILEQKFFPKPSDLVIATMTCFLLLGSAVAVQADAADCSDVSDTDCSTDGADILNPVIAELEKVFNAGWSAASKAEGLDPFDNVYSGSVHIGCTPSTEADIALTAYCVGEGYIDGCKDFWVDVNISEIDGLSELQLENMQVNTITGESGTQTCPYDSDATGGTFDCSYSGTGTGNGYLQGGDELTLKASEFEVKIKCTEGFNLDHTFTYYNGSFTCTSKEPTAKATFDFCGGSCADDVGQLTYLAIPKGGLELSPGNISCDFSPDTDPVSWFLDAFVPLFKQDLANALRDPVAEAINSIFTLPFPSSACSSDSN